MDTTTFEVRTGSDFAVVEVTRQAADFVSGRGDGLCHLFVPHATAGLGLMETGSGSEGDARTAIEGILPRDRVWQHRHGSPGHGADHLLPLVVNPSLSLPVLDGRLALGTWQSVVLIDSNRDNPSRTVRASFLAG